jgi:hypothetical protein
MVSRSKATEATEAEMSSAARFDRGALGRSDAAAVSTSRKSDARRKGDLALPVCYSRQAHSEPQGRTAVLRRCRETSYTWNMAKPFENRFRFCDRCLPTSRRIWRLFFHTVERGPAPRRGGSPLPSKQHEGANCDIVAL